MYKGSTYMTKEIIINATNEETRIAILEDGTLMELFVEKPETQRMVGDIYKGKVSNVLPGMKAAFINIGFEQNAFLHFSDVSESTHMFLLDFDDEEEERQHTRNEDNFDAAKDLKKNQDIVVQIMKEPIGSKGCRVTSQISIPGRFAVLVPNQSYIGVSRKITNFKEKKRLRRIAQQVLPKKYGLILRTQAEDKSEKVIGDDIKNLLKTWEQIDQRLHEQQAPSMVYKDMGMASSIIRDVFTPDVSKVVVDSRKLMRELTMYVKEVAPKLRHKIEYYKIREPIFEHFKIEDEIKRSMLSKIWLKNGAYLVIQQTEAMVVIDVNSGKFIGKKDHESNSLRINLEAAREIARQARLRDLGGLIVIDFIDVQQDSNKTKILNELRKEFQKDRSITKIEPMSRFGLMEMTRQRVRPSVLHSIHEDCPMCNGTGLVPTLGTLVADLERWIQQYRAGRGDRRITIRVTGETYNYLNAGKFSRRLQLMWRYWIKINLFKDDSLPFRQFKVFDRKNEKEIILKT
jgi:ribonuclease G